MNCDVGGAHIEVTLDPNPIDHGLAPEWDTIGVITKSAKNELTVDTCAPNSGCSPSFTKVSIQAPGLEVLFPLGAFVRLHVATSTYNNGLHATTFGVRNVPTWSGAANPVSTTDRWYLLTSEQSLEHPDAPFEVSSSALPCPGPLQGGKGKLYDVIFTDPGGGSTKLAHNQAATLMLGGQSWNVQVLRAYESYNLDRENAFSWYAESIE